MKIVYNRLIGYFIILMFLGATFSVVNAEPLAGPELEIVEITGKIGRVCTEIKNIGDEDAEKVVITISVKGGIFNRINISKTCSGCGHCNTTIAPNASKIECTDKFILGLGNVEITVTAEAENANKVTSTKNGLVFGFLILIQ